MRGSWAREHQAKSTGQYSSDHTVFARLLPYQAQSPVQEQQHTVAVKCYWFGQLALLARANLVCLGVLASALMCLLPAQMGVLLKPWTSNTTRKERATSFAVNSTRGLALYRTAQNPTLPSLVWVI